MLDAQLSEWLDAQAQALDQGQCDPQQVLARLAGAEVLRVGIDPAQGGSGGDLTDALEVMASVASHSLAAAFVCWASEPLSNTCCTAPMPVCASACCPRCSAASWPVPPGCPMP
ncbi:hypothetical protein PBOI14_40890 [Pseudomonas sp. Boi14]|nr:hypothetical protein PBOI14_40890 [Pseudomonas sp. Boi14]